MFRRCCRLLVVFVLLLLLSLLLLLWLLFLRLVVIAFCSLLASCCQQLSFSSCVQRSTNLNRCLRFDDIGWEPSSTHATRTAIDDEFVRQGLNRRWT